MADVSNLSVAIVGAGLMGQWHAHFARQCGASICGVVDRNDQRARELSARIGCNNVFTDIPGLLAQCTPQIMHICTPTDTHGALVDASLDAGCHALVEKPLATTLDATERLLRHAHERNLLVNPVHQFAFQRGFCELMDRLGAMGTPVRIEFLTCSSGGDNRSDSERRSILTEILPHPISLLYRLFPARLTEQTLKVTHFSDDSLEMVGTIDDTYISIGISLRGRPTRNELTVVCANGTATLDLFHGYAVFETGAATRFNKILKPFKYAAGTFAQAGANLVRRAATDEPAYPGLRELIAGFYAAAAQQGAAPIDAGEILLAARARQLVESVPVSPQ